MMTSNVSQRLGFRGADTSSTEFASAKPKLEKLRKATDGLESFMFKNLLKGIGKENGGLFGKMPGSDIYRDMFEQTMSDQLASKGSLGISDLMYGKVAPMAVAEERTKQMLAASASRREAQNSLTTEGQNK
jgi:Rod binding domain-containing protein